MSGAGLVTALATPWAMAATGWDVQTVIPSSDRALISCSDLLDHESVVAAQVLAEDDHYRKGFSAHLHVGFVLWALMGSRWLAADSL